MERYARRAALEVNQSVCFADGKLVRGIVLPDQARRMCPPERSLGNTSVWRLPPMEFIAVDTPRHPVIGAGAGPLMVTHVRSGVLDASQIRPTT